MRTLTAKLIVFGIAAAWPAVGAAQMGFGDGMFWLVGEIQAGAALKLNASCTLAARSDETLLRAMEARIDGELADILNRERSDYRAWTERLRNQNPRDPDSITRATDAKIQYWGTLMVAKASVEAYENIKKCVAERRRVLAGGPGAPTPTPNIANVCATTEGPLRCTGAFAGPYQWTCDGDSRLAQNQGIGTLRLTADGQVSLAMLNDGELSGQFLRVDPAAGGESVGHVWADRSFSDSRERYEGSFSTVVVGAVVAGASPTRTVVGSATYFYNTENLRCQGRFAISR
jgi:hypothetical protein